MFDLKAHSFEVAVDEDGRYVAASASSPFFFFQADTEQDVLAIVKDALDFYASAPGTVAEKPRAAPPTLHRVQHRQTVRVADLLPQAA